MVRTRSNFGWWIRRFSLLIISTAFSLALVEGMASFWLYRIASQDQFRHYGTLEQSRKRFDADGKTDMRFAPHRYLGYVLSPGYSRGENYHNSQGYRGDPFPTPKPDKEFRIFCLGASTTYGRPKLHPSQAYPAMMERTLHERGYDYVRVINAGVPGWTTFETLVNFQFRILDQNPDMIIVYHGYSDVVARMVLPSTAYKGDNSGTRPYVTPYGKRLPLIEHSTIVRIILTQFGDRNSPLELANVFDTFLPTAVYWPYIAQFNSGKYPSRLFKVYPLERIFELNRPIYFRRNLENLVATAKRQKVTTVLSTFALSPNYDTGPIETPVLINASPAILAAIDEQNEIMQELGQGSDVHVYDFAANFPREARFFEDPAHLNRLGAQKKGTMFAEYLLSEGLIPKR